MYCRRCGKKCSPIEAENAIRPFPLHGDDSKWTQIGSQHSGYNFICPICKSKIISCELCNKDSATRFRFVGNEKDVKAVCNECNVNESVKFMQTLPIMKDFF